MYNNKKIFILGMARSGFDAAKLLSEYNNDILVTDGKSQNEGMTQELESLGVKVVITDDQVSLLDDSFDILIKNPGIKYDNPVVLKARELDIKVINEMEMAYSFLDKSVNVIGVTGSNGKTTTTTLIYEIMKEKFKDVYLGGNIGVPLSNFVKTIKPNSYLILEISDHQLCDMYDFKTNVSVLTNITPTHLDFHESFLKYQMTKKKIFNNHTNNDLAIINKNDEISMDITNSINSNKVYFGDSKDDLSYYDEFGIYYDGKLIIKNDELIVKGNHNYQNIAAAIIVAKYYGVEDEIIKKVITNFKGVEHRLEFVDEVNGVKYYNDSKSTNCVSTITALKSFDKNIILLLGGLDRGHSFHDLDQYMEGVKVVVAFGETSNRIKEFCDDLNIKCYKFETLKEGMNIIRDISLPGDTVLLSPACASWDQYEKFEDRGLEFKKLVNEIKNK